MATGRPLISLTLILAIQIGSAGAFDAFPPEKTVGRAAWEKTRHGSTIVLRPVQTAQASKKPLPSEVGSRRRKPYIISGHSSIADFVQELLGFSDVDSEFGVSRMESRLR